MNSRIGLISYGLDRNPGGIGHYTRELYSALRHIGIDVTLLGGGSARLRGSRRLPGLLTVGQLEIARLAKRDGLQIIHDPTGSAPMFLTRARRVITIHDVIPYVQPKTSTGLDWLIYHYWLPIAVQRLDAIITVSERSKADIVGHLPVKSKCVHVIPAAAAARFRCLPRQTTETTLSRYGIDFPYILFIGSIEPRKNLKRLMEAYAQVFAWSQEWRLVIVGARKAGYAHVSRRFESAPIASHIHFMGYVPDEDLPAFYNGASVFAFPSLYEGFGLPVLEAMSCGTPVVTSNNSSLPEVAGDAAILTDPFDVDTLTFAIRRTLEDHELVAELRLKGLARAQCFSWERAARATAQIYERLLNSGTVTSHADED